MIGGWFVIITFSLIIQKALQGIGSYLSKHGFIQACGTKFVLWSHGARPETGTGIPKSILPSSGGVLLIKFIDLGLPFFLVCQIFLPGMLIFLGSLPLKYFLVFLPVDCCIGMEKKGSSAMQMRWFRPNYSR